MEYHLSIFPMKSALQFLPHFLQHTGIHLFLNLIDNLGAVHLCHFNLVDVHTHIAHKTENPNHRAQIEAVLRLNAFLLSVEVIEDVPVSGMDGGYCISLII